MLPFGWSEAHSRTHGRPYYYHGATGRVTWEFPLETGTRKGTCLSSLSSTAGCDRKDESGGQDLSTTGDFSMYGEESLSSTLSSESFADSSGAESGDVAEPLALTPRLENLTKRLSQKLNVQPGSLCREGVVLRKEAPEAAIQLSEEIYRYESATMRIDELKALLSNMELELWAVEAALANEKQRRLRLKEQLDRLDIEARSRVSELQNAQRLLATCELRLRWLLVGAVEANRKASEGLDTQPRAWQWFTLEKKLWGLEAQLRRQESRQSALLADIAKCTASVIGFSNAVAMSVMKRG